MSSSEPTRPIIGRGLSQEAKTAQEKLQDQSKIPAIGKEGETDEQKARQKFRQFMGETEEVIQEQPSPFKALFQQPHALEKGKLPVTEASSPTPPSHLGKVTDAIVENPSYVHPPDLTKMQPQKKGEEIPSHLPQSTDFWEHSNLPPDLPLRSQPLKNGNEASLFGPPGKPILSGKQVPPLPPKEISTAGKQALSLPEETTPMMRQKIMEIAAPFLSLLPAKTQNLALNSITTASHDLPTSTHPLFFQLASGMYAMSATATLSQMDMTLNNPLFTKLFGSTLTIEKSATKPDSFDINLAGNKTAVAAFKETIPSLQAAFQNSDLPVKIDHVKAQEKAPVPSEKTLQQQTVERAAPFFSQFPESARSSTISLLTQVVEILHTMAASPSISHTEIPLTDPLFSHSTVTIEKNGTMPNSFNIFFTGDNKPLKKAIPHLENVFQNSHLPFSVNQIEMKPTPLVKKVEQPSMETVAPLLSQLPESILPLALASTTASLPYLQPSALPLFVQMIGTLYTMSASPAILRTEMTFSHPAFAHSPFSNATVTIEKNETLPDAFNIHLSGNNPAVTTFLHVLPNLQKAFQNSDLPFTMSRIETALPKSEKPLQKEIETARPKLEEKLQNEPTIESLSKVKKGEHDQTIVEMVAPTLPLLPGTVQPLAIASTAAATPYLHPSTMPLFFQMVGQMYVMSTPPGISRTEITLNNPAFADSKFYGTTITLERYATAPDSYNIRLSGNDAAVAAFRDNIPSLMTAFRNSNLPFNVGRIEAEYTLEKPVFRRREGGAGDQGGSSGDQGERRNR